MVISITVRRGVNHLSHSRDLFSDLNQSQQGSNVCVTATYNTYVTMDNTIQWTYVRISEPDVTQTSSNEHIVVQSLQFSCKTKQPVCFLFSKEESSV